MFIKTIIASIILIFLLQQIYNFIYDKFLVKTTNIKFSAIEKYKKIAEEATAAAAAAAASGAKHTVNDTIETVFDITEASPLVEATPPPPEEDMENCLLNLVING